MYKADVDITMFIKGGDNGDNDDIFSWIDYNVFYLIVIVIFNYERSREDT